MADTFPLTSVMQVCFLSNLCIMHEFAIAESLEGL